jgi:HPt (histidine-containing phosphotransfer) domain-containing protein
MAMMQAEAVQQTGSRRVAVAAAQPCPVLDLDHLRRFTGGNRALEREVLALFAEQAPRTLRDMQLAATEKAWRDAAHTLKGSAYAVGANVVASTAAEAEALRADPSRWPQIIDRLDKALREVDVAIAAAA